MRTDYLGRVQSVSILHSCLYSLETYEGRWIENCKNKIFPRILSWRCLICTLTQGKIKEAAFGRLHKEGGPLCGRRRLWIPWWGLGRPRARQKHVHIQAIVLRLCLLMYIFFMSLATVHHPNHPRLKYIPGGGDDGGRTLEFSQAPSPTGARKEISCSGQSLTPILGQGPT